MQTNCLTPVRASGSADSQAVATASLLGLCFASLCVCLSLCLTGCGPQRAGDVQVDLARQTLTRVLEHWKSGGAIGDLRQEVPEIIVQEAAWSSGQKLQDFVLNGAAEALDGNWFCEVELTLASPTNGKTYTKTVTYAVGTDPVLTVFHAML